jgi:hypothetical protein
MPPGERAMKRSPAASDKLRKPAERDTSDREVQRLVRAFRAIRSARLRANILGFTESIALRRGQRRGRRKAD